MDNNEYDENFLKIYDFIYNNWDEIYHTDVKNIVNFNNNNLCIKYNYELNYDKNILIFVLTLMLTIKTMIK